MTFNHNLIAPCGMNCGLCAYHLREKNSCPGCNSGERISKRCMKCAIKLCKERKGDYCYDCDKFPCEQLKRLDKIYQEKYGVSEIENLRTIKEKGLKTLLEHEETKWVDSDGIFCVHDRKRYPRRNP